MARRQQHSSVKVQAHSPERFEASDTAMLGYLEEHGYAVVCNALQADSEEMERIKSEFWDFHEMIGGGVRRDDPSTWGRELIAHPATGIIAGFGFGQSRFLWSIRTLPVVRAAFEAIWQTEDLITSFDGGNAFRPDPDWRTQGGWWHCDQNGTKPNRAGRVCVQGLVLLTPANEYTGGFCVMPGTHTQHAAFSERHPWAEQQGDFLPVPEGDEILAAGGRLLRAEAGDLILWDSRTIHCNTPAIAPASEAPAGAVPPRDQLLRLAGYVCFAPSSWCSPDVAEQRARAALELVTSTHWPHAYVATGQAPEWMGQRTPDDYSRAEARLVLGDHGKWPVDVTMEEAEEEKEAPKARAPTAAAEAGVRSSAFRRAAAPVGATAGGATAGAPGGTAARARSKGGAKPLPPARVAAPATVEPAVSERASGAARRATLPGPLAERVGSKAAPAVRGTRRPLPGLHSMQPKGRPPAMDRSSSSSGGLLGRLYEVLSPGRGQQPSRGA